MVQKSLKKNQNSLKREGASSRLREDTAPENSSDRTMFSMVRLSEGHCYEAFQKIGLSFNSCGMEFYREKKIQKLNFVSQVFNCKCKLLVSFLEYNWEFQFCCKLIFYYALYTRHVIKLGKLQKYVFQHNKGWERKLVSISF